MQHCHYRIQFAEPNRIPELRRLWSDIFGDSDDYTALFFSRVYAPGRALIATVDEQVAAMLFFPRGAWPCRGNPCASAMSAVRRPGRNTGAAGSWRLCWRQRTGICSAPETLARF